MLYYNEYEKIEIKGHQKEIKIMYSCSFPQKFLALLFLIFLSFAWTQRKQTLRIGDFGAPSSFDPITARRPIEHHLCQFVYDGLLTPTMQGHYRFNLAKEMDISPDGLSFTFILHENLCWADGTPLTTKDVEFTLALLLNRNTQNYNSTLANYIENVVCISPEAITITLSKPFYKALSLFTFKIVPKHKIQIFNQAEKNYLSKNHPFRKAPMGSGPFLFSKIGKKTITLLPNKNCKHRRTPLISKIIVKLYASKRKALEDLLKKKIYLLAEISPKDISKISKKFTLQRYESRTIHFLAINHRANHRHHEILSLREFRQALLQSIDRKTILKKTFYAESRGSRIISGPFPANSWAYNQKLEPHIYNYSQAKRNIIRILRRNGYERKKDKIWYKNGKALEFSLKCMREDREMVRACTQIAKTWKKLGLKIKVERRKRKILHREIYFQHDFDFVYTKYSFDNTFNVIPLFDSKNIGKGKSNFSGYVDSKLMELFFQLRNTLNPWTIRSISHKIHRMVYKNTIHLFLWQLDIYAAHNHSLKNFKRHPYYLFNSPERWKIID